MIPEIWVRIKNELVLIGCYSWKETLKPSNFLIKGEETEAQRGAATCRRRHSKTNDKDSSGSKEFCPNAKKMVFQLWYAGYFLFLNKRFIYLLYMRVFFSCT